MGSCGSKGIYYTYAYSYLTVLYDSLGPPLRSDRRGRPELVRLPTLLNAFRRSPAFDAASTEKEFLVWPKKSCNRLEDVVMCSLGIHHAFSAVVELIALRTLVPHVVDALFDVSSEPQTSYSLLSPG